MLIPFHIPPTVGGRNLMTAQSLTHSHCFIETKLSSKRLYTISRVKSRTKRDLQAMCLGWWPSVSGSLEGDGWMDEVRLCSIRIWNKISVVHVRWWTVACSAWWIFANRLYEKVTDKLWVLYKATTTSTLDVCPPASPQFAGPKITSISHFFFLMWKWKLSNPSS